MEEKIQEEANLVRKELSHMVDNEKFQENINEAILTTTSGYMKAKEYFNMKALKSEMNPDKAIDEAIEQTSPFNDFSLADNYLINSILILEKRIKELENKL